MTKNAHAFLMSLDGMPVVNQGQEQRYSGANDPYNRLPLWDSDYNTKSELYQWIAKLNKFRTLAIKEDESFISSKASVIFNNTHIIGLKKGNAVTIATNVGLGASKTNITLTQEMTGYDASKTYVDVLGCEKYKTTRKGSLNIEVGSDPKILFPAKALKETGWKCGKKGKKATKISKLQIM